MESIQMIELFEKGGIATVAAVCLATLIWAFKYQIKNTQATLKGILAVMEEIKTWMANKNGKS